MFFASIPGQEEIKNQLMATIASGDIPHAMLLCGSPGWGVLPMARAVSSSLLCEAPKSGESCGLCRSCKQSHQLAHPDLHLTVPVIGSKMKAADVIDDWRQIMMSHPYADTNDWREYLLKEGKQPNINVRELHEILDFAHLSTYQGDRKVLLIWQADLLGTDGNRLLKLIEEPPTNMYIILVAEDRERILHTIRSRCQFFAFAPVSDEALHSYVIAHYQVEPDKGKNIVFEADGDIGKAMRMAQGRHSNTYHQFVQWMRVIYRLSPKDVQKFSKEFLGWEKEEMKNFFEIGLQLMEAIMFLGYLPPEQIRMPKETMTACQGLATFLEFEQVTQIIDILNQSIRALERNVHTKTLFYRQSMTIHNLMHKRDRVSRMPIAL